MEKEDIYKALKSKVFGEVLFNEPMRNHTSFKIGGPADIMIIPKKKKDITQSIKYCRDNCLNYYIMGNGTNLLVKDSGIRGIVIKIANGYGDITMDGEKVICQSGALLSVIAKQALKQSIRGFEFAAGIPGTIGGAVSMNAGAYGGEMKDVVTGVSALDKDNRIVELNNKDLKFRYRGSVIVEKELTVLEVELQLAKGERYEIEEKLTDFAKRRAEKQPLEFPSGGSIFKRPKGYYAGKLIEDAGLRGIRYGDAQVSEKHCGFIINRGNANFQEVYGLIKTVQKIVFDKFNIGLETEIKIIGKD